MTPHSIPARQEEPPERYSRLTEPHFDAMMAELASIKAEVQGTSRRSRGRRSGSPSASSSFTVRAPMAPREGRSVVRFTAATPRFMASLLGAVRLRIDRESIDLERLSSGLLALVDGHDTTRLLGRVTEATITPEGALEMAAEMGTTGRSRTALREMRDGSRAGYSPGFFINDVAVVDESDDGYKWEVTQWGPYEVSSTPIPRNPEALHIATMEASMSTSALADAHTQGPVVVSFDDPAGLSLALVRAALDNPATSDKHRHRLQVFEASVERALAQGMPKLEAVAMARDEMRGVIREGLA